MIRGTDIDRALKQREADVRRREAALRYEEKQREKRRAAVVPSQAGRRARRAPVNPVSDKRRVEAAVYRKRRSAFLAANPACAAAPWHDLIGVECDGRATTIQHKQGRVGDLYLDESKWLGLSLPCHRFVTDHPALAVQLGLAELRIGAAS